MNPNQHDKGFPMYSAFRHTFAIPLILAALTLLRPTPVSAQQAGGSDSCSQPMPDPVSVTTLGEEPNGFAFTRDNCWIFVAVGWGSNKPQSVGLLVLQRANGTIKQVRSLSFQGRVQRVALTHDEKILIAPSNREVSFLDVEKLISGKGDPVLGRISDGHFLGASDVRITSDDKYAFVLQLDTAWTSIIDVAKARKTGFGPDAIVGGVPNGKALQGMVLSPDDKYLYNAHLELPGGGGPPSCRNAEPWGPPNTREAGVSVIDVQRAIAGAPSAILASFGIGCGGASLSLSPDGDTMYVLHDGTLLVYDVKPFRMGAAPILLSTQPATGSAVSTFDGGKRIALSGFYGPQSPPMVVDVTKLAAGKDAIIGTIAGSGPIGPLRATTDGNSLIGNDRDPGALVIIDLKRLTLQPVKP